MIKFIFKFKYIFPKSKEEIMDIIIALSGIVMICISVFGNNYESDTLNSKLLSVVGDLGIGLFPTGVISFLLEKMQQKQKDIEKQKKRATILYNLNIALHAYLNAVCNLAIAKKHSLKGHTVSDILRQILENNMELESSTDEINALTHLIEKMKDLFQSPNPIYIIADIFNEDEMKHFHLLIKAGENALNFITEANSNSLQRNCFLSYLLIAFEEISEYNVFLKMESNGHNISIAV